MEVLRRRLGAKPQDVLGPRRDPFGHACAFLSWERVPMHECGFLIKIISLATCNLASRRLHNRLMPQAESRELVDPMTGPGPLILEIRTLRYGVLTPYCRALASGPQLSILHVLLSTLYRVKPWVSFSKKKESSPPEQEASHVLLTNRAKSPALHRAAPCSIVSIDITTASWRLEVGSWN